LNQVEIFEARAPELNITFRTNRSWLVLYYAPKELNTSQYGRTNGA